MGAWPHHRNGETSEPHPSNVPIAPIAPEDADEHFIFLAGLLGLDSPASCEATRELLHWTPTGPGLIADLDQGHYFAPRT